MEMVNFAPFLLVNVIVVLLWKLLVIVQLTKNGNGQTKRDKITVENAKSNYN